MEKKVIISGATGLIGRKLISALTGKGYTVTVLSRNKRLAEKTLIQDVEVIEWDYTKPAEEIVFALRESFAVINLAGASIAGRRWNAEYKKLIYDSRVITTRKISEAISKCNIKPSVFINASASGYYGFDGEEILTEESPAGNDYLAEVCRDWESSAFESEKYGVRTSVIRIAVVLDKNEGALTKMLTPYKFFIGGHLGSGRQWFPWIHVSDLVNLFLFVLENDNISGAVNGGAPEQIRNKEFSKAIGKALGRPSLFPVPGFILKIVTGEFAAYLLKGRRMLPEKALKNNFKFKYETAEEALNNILR